MRIDRKDNCLENMVLYSQLRKAILENYQRSQIT